MDGEIVARANPEREQQKALLIERYGKLLDSLTDEEFERIHRPGNERWLDSELERGVHRVVGRKSTSTSRIGSGL